jgi:hypothetical protein
MSTNFGPVIYSLRGRPISEATVALRLQNDLQVPEGSARNVAKALIESARNAELLTGDDDRLDAAAIESVASVIPTPESRPAPGRGTSTQPEGTQQRNGGAAPKPKRLAKPIVKEEPRPLAGGVQVVVKVDASNLTPEQIVELVQKLQQPPT